MCGLFTYLKTYIRMVVALGQAGICGDRGVESNDFPEKECTYWHMKLTE